MNNMAEPITADPKPKLRWFQFSLRSLFILTFLVACASSWVAVKMGQARKQKEAVGVVIKLGGQVVYDYGQYSAGRPIIAITGVKSLDSSWLRKVLGDDFFSDVTYINASNSMVTNADVDYLKGLKVSPICLCLNNTHISDAGLERLKDMNRLKELQISNTQVTDAGLESMKGLNQLQRLYISGTKITNAGLVHLIGLNQLRYLDLKNTQVTDAGVAKLQKALPNCEIIH
jgi:hypothetical protein